MTEMRRTVTRSPSMILSIAVTLTVAISLFVTVGAKVRVAAHPGAMSLPTIRLGYFEVGGRLATSLDPALVSLANDADTIDLYLAAPLFIGTDDKVHLGLIQRYTVSKNRKVYDLYLRKARFHDGHPITAGDIKFAIERSLAPSTASTTAETYLDSIQGAHEYAHGKPSSVVGVKAISSNHLRVTLVKPYAFFLMQFTFLTSWPLDPAVVKGKTAAETGNYLTHNCPATRQTASGPFLFVCSGNDFHPAGQTPRYTLEPNPTYYGKKAHVRPVLPAYGAIDTGYKGYLAGDIDTTGIPTGFVARWKKNPRHQFLQWPTSNISFLTPNTHLAPMKDVHCRLAVAYGIDRAKIATHILHGLFKPIYSILPRGFLGYYSGKDSPHFNLKKAQSEFKACGSVRSTAFKLVYPTGSSDADNQFNETNSELRKVGFNVTLQALSVNDWINVVSQSLDKTQAVLVSNGWAQDYPDPQDYVTTLLRCGKAFDTSGWCNSTFVKLVDKADLEGNPKKRAQEYIAAQQLAIHAGAFITLFHNLNQALVKPCVHGLIGTLAYFDLVPRNQQWSTVSKSGKC